MRTDTRCPRARKAFTHYPEIIDDLTNQGMVVGSRVDFAFWRHLFFAIIEGRQRKADEFLKEYFERHAEDDERRR